MLDIKRKRITVVKGERILVIGGGKWKKSRNIKNNVAILVHNRIAPESLHT